MAMEDRVTVDPRICDGKPSIKGRGIPIAIILDELAAGRSEAELLGEFPGLQHEDILAALEYGAARARQSLASTPTAGIAGLVLLVMVHVGLLLLIGVELLFARRLEKTFKEFDMQLPWATECVMAITDWLFNFVYFLPILFSFGLAADGTILFFLRQHLRMRTLSWLWFFLVTAALMIAIATVPIALIVPLIKLQEGLSR